MTIVEGNDREKIFDMKLDHPSRYSLILANPIHEPIEEHLTGINLVHFDELIRLVGLIDGPWAANDCRDIGALMEQASFGAESNLGVVVASCQCFDERNHFGV